MSIKSTTGKALCYSQGMWDNLKVAISALIGSSCIAPPIRSVSVQAQKSAAYQNRDHFHMPVTKKACLYLQDYKKPTHLLNIGSENKMCNVKGNDQ